MYVHDRVYYFFFPVFSVLRFVLLVELQTAFPRVFTVSASFFCRLSSLSASFFAASSANNFPPAVRIRCRPHLAGGSLTVVEPPIGELIIFGELAEHDTLAVEGYGILGVGDGSESSDRPCDIDKEPSNAPFGAFEASIDRCRPWLAGGSSTVVEPPIGGSSIFGELTELAEHGTLADVEGFSILSAGDDSDQPCDIDKEPSNAPFEASEASTDLFDASIDCFDTSRDDRISAAARASASAAARSFNTFVEVGGGWDIAGSKLGLGGIRNLAPEARGAGVLGRLRPSNVQGSGEEAPGANSFGFGCEGGSADGAGEATVRSRREVRTLC